MDELNKKAFVQLFKEAHQKCFGSSLTGVLSETESKHFGNSIFEATGLVIGAKSIKNYAAFIFQGTESRDENPSVATLDTLARYVLDAPFTDEIERKKKEGHHPYWFRYKSKFGLPSTQPPPVNKRAAGLAVLLFTLAGIAVVIALRFFDKKSDQHFVDQFLSTGEDSLKAKGWTVKSRDNYWFEKRGDLPAHLTLFTLTGDNWPDSVHVPDIRNLLIRSVDADCFSAEVHFDRFMPLHNWQQAGLLLLEDSSLTGRSIRLSIAYNDFFGGYTKPGEIIIQAIQSGGPEITKPEEIAHIPLFNIDTTTKRLVADNMQRSALRIEKTGNHYRFLYSASPLENFALKEAFNRDLDIHPKYIGLFALQGFVKDTNYAAVHVNYFNLTGLPCKK
jgi:hypothetical protein